MKINVNEFSKQIDENLKFINFKRVEFKIEFENVERTYRKISKKELDKSPDKNLGELENIEELQNFN